MNTIKETLLKNHDTEKLFVSQTVEPKKSIPTQMWILSVIEGVVILVVISTSNK